MVAVTSTVPVDALSDPSAAVPSASSTRGRGRHDARTASPPNSGPPFGNETTPYPTSRPRREPVRAGGSGGRRAAALATRRSSDDPGVEIRARLRQRRAQHRLDLQRERAIQIFVALRARHADHQRLAGGEIDQLDLDRARRAVLGTHDGDRPHGLAELRARRRAAPARSRHRRPRASRRGCRTRPDRRAARPQAAARPSTGRWSRPPRAPLASSAARSPPVESTRPALPDDNRSQK